MKLCDEAILEDHRPASTDAWTSLTATDLTYPSGRQVTSGYDALYRRNSVSETSGGASIAAWQFFGNRTALVELGNGVTCSFMNNAGTRSAVQAGQATPPWGDKTTDQLGYDGSGRLISKRFLPSSSTTALVGFTTSYDPSSNKLFERALHAETRSALYPNYDSINRLLEYDRGTLASGGGSITTPIMLSGTDSQRTYDLDHLGNWKNTAYTPAGGSPTTEIRRHNLVNQITKFASTPVKYDHGNNGASTNPVIATRGNGNIANDGTLTYAYDALNRLANVSCMRGDTPTPIASYSYDAFGRRVLKVVSNNGLSGTIANATYRYLYDGNQIVEELLLGETTTTLRQFVWGQYIDELIQLNVPTTTTAPPLTAGTYYPLQDLLYRTIATTNSSGAIVEAYDYDAYGNTLMYNGPGTDGQWFTDDDVTTLQPMCEFLFTGRQYDPETEIYWYRARYYHPLFGRFLSRDLRPTHDRLNLYQYVRANLMLNTDPTGFEPVPPATMLSNTSGFEQIPVVDLHAAQIPAAAAGDVLGDVKAEPPAVEWECVCVNGNWQLHMHMVQYLTERVLDVAKMPKEDRQGYYRQTVAHEQNHWKTYLQFGNEVKAKLGALLAKSWKTEACCLLTGVAFQENVTEYFEKARAYSHEFDTDRWTADFPATHDIYQLHPFTERMPEIGKCSGALGQE